MSITKQDFNKQCLRFVSMCQNVDENWSLISADSGQHEQIQSNLNNPDEYLDSRLMLMKSDFQFKISNKIQTSEYTVLYSESFEVPVMYFCASNQDGSPLSIDDSIVQTLGIPENDIGQVISQVEHPLLFRPFFMIHPCRTKNFMEPHTKIQPDNYLICWLSTVGTMLGLRLDPRLANLDRT